MRNYFRLADTSNDKKVSESEFSEFLETINIKLKKDQLKKLINVFIYLFVCKMYFLH
jgi:hypothetical protein